MARFLCKQCGYQQSVDDQFIGRATKCPKCKHASAIEPTSAEDSIAEDSIAEELMPEQTPEQGLLVLKASGGSIRTRLSRTIILNKESSLEREFITVIDTTMPVGLCGCTGVVTAYEPETDYSAGEYYYSAGYAVKALEGICAFEVRFLLFNVWGRHVSTLTATDVSDLDAGATKPVKSRWNLYDENEASEHYASIA